MWTIANKEFRELLYNQRFLLTLAASALLIFLSVFNGYIVFKSESAAMAEAEATVWERLKTSWSYEFVNSQAFRYPDKLIIFDIGLSGVVGRRGRASVSAEGGATMSAARSAGENIFDHRYEADPVLAVFGELDLTYSVAYILSLFAIAFSFSAVNGERERGTLRLILSGSTPRSSVILGKLLGGYLPLALLFILPFITALLGLLLMGDINFSAAEWGRLAAIALAALLYLLLFHAMGVAMSALTRTSFASFMLCLLFWVLSAAVIPKSAVQAAALFDPPMSVYELNNRTRAVNQQMDRELWFTYTRRFNERRITEEDFQNRNIRREIWGVVQEEIEKKRGAMLKRILDDFLRRRKKLLESALVLSRFSPSSCYILANSAVSGNGPRLQENFERSLRDYKVKLKDYIDRKYQQNKEFEAKRRDRPQYEFVAGEDGFITVVENKAWDKEADVSDMPLYSMPPLPVEALVENSLVEFAVPTVIILIFIAIAYVAFLRYDAR